MMQLHPEWPSAYTALRQGAAVWAPSAAELLVLTDVERSDFLQRMTTNNIKRLRAGSSCVTVLTSPTAKIVQVFTVLAGSDLLWLLPTAGQGAALERHLRGQIFFMDKVRVSRPEQPVTRLRVLGPQAAAALSRVGCHSLPQTDGDWLQDGERIVLCQTEYDLPGYELIVPAADAAALRCQLDAVELDEASYTARRIELGRPAPGAELTGEYSPLEAGLAWSCAENKGCYTGQEILARQMTYDKITRSLVGLKLQTSQVAGAAVWAEGREVGQITSAAFSPQLSAPVALAILKRPYHLPGTAVSVAGSTATVAALPLV